MASLAAPPLNARFRAHDVEVLIQKGHLRKIEDLLSDLPLSFRKNYVLIYDSASLQQASGDLPRIVFYSDDAKMLLAVTGPGNYPSVNVQTLAHALGLKTAIISSGNSLDFTDLDLKTLRSHGAILKDMEAGGIGWVSFVTKTPFFAIKAVTNLIDENPDSPKEFERNFEVAVTQMTTQVLHMIEKLSELDLRAQILVGKTLMVSH